MEPPNVEHASFARRAGALILDSIFASLLGITLLYLIYGRPYSNWLMGGDASPTNFGPAHLIVDYLLPFVLTVVFWVRLKATPGKLLLGCQVVDASTGEGVSPGQAVLRYLGYILSTLPLGLGFFWMLWDRRRQTFHDKLAGTVVVIEDEARKPLHEWVRELP
jgi:uncharacterized RDD family membrane protein YckC